MGALLKLTYFKNFTEARHMEICCCYLSQNNALAPNFTETIYLDNRFGQGRCPQIVNIQMQTGEIQHFPHSRSVIPWIECLQPILETHRRLHCHLAHRMVHQQPDLFNISIYVLNCFTERLLLSRKVTSNQVNLMQHNLI